MSHTWEFGDWEPVGDLTVWVRQIKVSDGDTRDSELRGCLKGVNGTLGANVGEAWADTASQGVCDFELFSTASGDDYPAYWLEAEEALISGSPYARLELDETTGATLVFCDSGWGDGTFAVHELLDGSGSGCGAEFSTIDETDPLPEWHGED